MTTSNHVITGAVIAVAIKQPAAALPLAFLSHFVLDFIPHFGYKGHRGFTEVFKHRLSFVVIAFDALMVAWLVGSFRQYGLIAYLGGLAAIAPDFIWLYRYYGFERHGKKPPVNKFANWHNQIQWCERPWGLMIEIAWFVAFSFLLTKLK